MTTAQQAPASPISFPSGDPVEISRTLFSQLDRMSQRCQAGSVAELLTLPVVSRAHDFYNDTQQLLAAVRREIDPAPADRRPTELERREARIKEGRVDVLAHMFACSLTDFAKTQSPLRAMAVDILAKDATEFMFCVKRLCGAMKAEGLLFELEGVRPQALSDASPEAGSSDPDQKSTTKARP